MRPLEEEIDDLTELDRFRIHAASLRDEGREALRAVLNDPSVPGWEDLGDLVETSLMVKALCQRGVQGPPLEFLVKQLEMMTLSEAFEPASDEVPVLRAARAMQALVAAPDSAFSKATMFFYYRVVREICSADAPDWTLGGARVGDGGSATAFMTGECVRAIMGFARTLDQTGTLLGELRKVLAERGTDQGQEIPSAWLLVERERQKLSFFITLKMLSGNLSFRFKPKLSDLSLEDLDSFLTGLSDNLREALTNATTSFEEALHELKEFRDKEEKGKRYDRSETGHLTALNAVDQAHQRAAAALALLVDEKDFTGALTKLEAMFHEVADDVRKLLHPAENFITAVLDRELAAAAVEGSLGWDAREMAFAAASYGSITGSWKDERLVRAGCHLIRVFSDRGRFPMGRPIYSKDKGYRLHVIGAEAMRAFAQLLQHVPHIPINPDLVRKMLAFFEDTRAPRPGTPYKKGWNHEEPRQPVRSCRWVTALAVLALDRINRMLDERINLLVFAHFSVRWPIDLDEKLILPNLFYPDYGLQRAPQGKQHTPIRRTESIALMLERMRAHVSGVHRLRSSWSPLYSVVLHGPAGTGKTTLMEALARSCLVPLVEITPSDIVIGGTEAVERRARTVFKALSLLTRVVIIFDEFDPVLLRRDPRARMPSSVFTFLTPGMLPKLKNLNQKAKRRGVAYALVTNLIGSLDEAAVRSGRFDEKIGIFPPDLLSRAGRLWSEILEFYSESQGALSVTPELKERVKAVVMKTAGNGMEVLGKKGWYTSPGKWTELQPGTPFDFIFNGRDEPDWRSPEAILQHVLGEGATADQEYLQWAWVRDWDDKLGENVDLETALNRVPEEPRLKREPPQHNPGFLALNQLVQIFQDISDRATFMGPKQIEEQEEEVGGV